MTTQRTSLNALPRWHQEMIARLLGASFPGQHEVAEQLATARFEIIDGNKSLNIFPSASVKAPVQKTIPVEASVADKDGILIQVLLFVRAGAVYMLEILREDGEPVKEMPSVDKFDVVVLAP